MKLNITRIILSVIFAGVLASCADLASIEKEVASLENRVQALEGQINTLNENVKAIQALANGGCISDLKEENGTYTITLADGKVITLKQGSTGVADAPVVAIDKDGYWTVDYGKGPEHILVDGKKVKAAGSDGFSPLFGVDANNNWTVSYDGGKTFQTIKGADGQPVSALPKEGIQDKWFNDVTVKDGKLVVVLKNGETYSLPIVPDFVCAIQNAAAPVVFNPGETKTFPVEMKGVASTLVTAPHGWNAVLNQTTLAVTAPMTTKAVSADSKSEVCILATSAEGFASIAKVKVQISDKPVVVNPTATIRFVEPAEINALSFQVSALDVTAWYYLLLPATDAAPSAETIETKGTAGKDALVKIEALKANTEYTFYVLPVNGAKKGEIAKANGKTLPEPVVELPGLFNKYNKGEQVVIGGVTVSKATHGEANYITADSADKTIKAGVNFIEPGAGATFGKDGIKLPLLVAGNIEGQRAQIKTSGQVGLLGDATLEDNIFAIENAEVVIENIGTAKYVFANNADFAINKITIKNCKINLLDHISLMYVAAARPVNAFVMEDSDIKVGQHIDTKTINILQTSGTYNMSEVNFTNNVIWSPVDAQWVSLLHNRNVTVDNLTVSHNTLVNVYPQPSYAYFQIKNMTAGKISNNLLFIENYETLITSYSGIVREMDGACDEALYGTFVQNYAIYGASVPTKRMKVGQNAKGGQFYNKKKADSAEIFDYTPDSANFDLVNGIFKSKNANYGAIRK